MEYKKVIRFFPTVMTVNRLTNVLFVQCSKHLAYVFRKKIRVNLLLLFFLVVVAAAVWFCSC